MSKYLPATHSSSDCQVHKLPQNVIEKAQPFGAIKM